jgi:esterase/lipase superfamily enzyme
MDASAMKVPNRLSLVLLVLVSLGCENSTQLMPTPNLYAHSEINPFADVPQELQSNSVDVLYLTDRQREDSPPQENAAYGYDRSRSVGFGTCHVEIGEHVKWDQLVAASRTEHRAIHLPMRLTSTKEVGRFPPTPASLVDLPVPEPQATEPSTQPTTRAQLNEAFAATDALLSAQLAKTPVKDVYLFVHGFNNTFDDSVVTIAGLWHFLGRQGVPIAYSWPAGHEGFMLTAYNYDRESSEFTVYHLKQVIRHIAENPDVHKIHIIAHSRGTDVVLSALRELHLEISGSGRSTRQVLKLGTLVLAAPDLDFEVIVQRAFTAQLGQVPENTVIYVCSQDNALGISTWLFGGLMRMGKLRSHVFTPEELNLMREKTEVEIIDARVSQTGMFGHDYFHSNPAVSSDLILLLRYHREPGAENGRPLKVEDDEFWTIDDQYPGPSAQPTESSQAAQTVSPTFVN